ncbi:MAG: hypothetical protein ABW192_05720 [Sphingobium sp.]
MPRAIAVASLCLLAITPATGRTGPAQGASSRVGQDYALATCLTQKAGGELRAEGYHLGSIAIGQSGLSPLDFTAVRDAVAKTLARTPMTTVHIDAPVDRSDRPALLAHCLASTRSPVVQAAITRLPRRR